MNIPTITTANGSRQSTGFASAGPAGAPGSGGEVTSGGSGARIALSLGGAATPPPDGSASTSADPAEDGLDSSIRDVDTNNLDSTR
jgi:hypothetical protein